MPEVIITAAPVHPAGLGYGLWWGTATHPVTGEQLVVGGLNEHRARSNAQRTAAREWGELRDHLTACELEAADVESGLHDLRD